MKNLCIADGGLYWEDDNGKEYAAEWEELTRAYEKEDKYRWHDLRKNPNDLPREDGIYLVCTNEYPNALDIYEVGHWETAYGYGGGWHDSFYDKVVAWREIEPYKR